MLITIYNDEIKTSVGIHYNSNMPIIQMNNLDEAVELVSSIWCEGCGDHCQLIDSKTGEILVEFEDGYGDDFDEEEFEEFYEDAFDETGYDPYLGCYDFDL